MILPKTFVDSNNITYMSDVNYTFFRMNFPKGNLIFLNNVYILWIEYEIMIQNSMLTNVLCDKLKLEYPFTQIKVRR